MLLIQQVIYFLAGLIEIQVKNHLSSHHIWVVVESNDTLPGQGGGFGLKPGEEKIFYQNVDWSGKIWARAWDGVSSLVCENTYCYPFDPNNPSYPGYNPGYPQALTVVEINLRARNGLDQYDISLLQGFNLPVTITPTGGKGDCRTISCDHFAVLNCPSDMHNWMEFLSCDSVCNRFNGDDYCCRGPYDNPVNCNPFNWPSDVTRHFQRECPNAYTYKYDSAKGQNTCSKAVQYTVTFG